MLLDSPHLFSVRKMLWLYLLSRVVVKPGRRMSSEQEEATEQRRSKKGGEVDEMTAVDVRSEGRGFLYQMRILT